MLMQRGGGKGWARLGSFAVVAWLPVSAAAATLTVGPGKTYQTVKAAVAAAKAGDTIEVDAGEYVDDISSIKVNDLTIRGVGGRPHLKATVPPPNKKGIFVVEQGVGPVTVENLEFSGSRISANDGNNGAGIRAQGTDLRVKNCYIHDNQNGILAGDGLMTIEGSEFAYNGEAGYEHNVYIGTAPKFVFRGNYTHHAKSGHAVKSRALENYIEYNRIMEEADGNGSALIDLPQGGLTYIVGNLIHKGPKAENKYRVVFYKGEGGTNPDLRLHVSHNTFVNDGAPAVVFIDALMSTEVVVNNNLFVGMGTMIKTAGDPMVTDAGNLQTEMGGLVDRAGYDYRLLPDAPGIDMGVAIDVPLVPLSHYVHPAMLEPRPVVDAPDIGAYEFGEAPADTTGGDPDSSSGGDDSSGSPATTGTGAETGDPTDGETATQTGGQTGGQTGDPATTGDTPDDTGQSPTSDGEGATGSSGGATSGEATDSSGATSDGGCGCTSDRQGGGWALLGLMGLGLRRRASRQR
ncbi:MAG: right-handed parallel beta-helix repeat-containing protein [Nannocystis sp.]|nr:right-handed parallel beta-helix repeat-containing protein [Nannocystis sp.]MBA3550465.1 right-handed parallel beta-helix repeat-containing protein [Nannocystis sp.]